MKIFQCDHCGHSLFFENYNCENCGNYSGYNDITQSMFTFDTRSEALVSPFDNLAYKYCKNKEYEACNWLLEKSNPQDFCNACQLNRTIPDLHIDGNIEKWRKLENAKHRLVYQLQKIGVELPSKLQHPDGICFDFVAQDEFASIMTGHSNGIITILLREADSVLREQMRKQFLEPYRTLIGHMRHEVGHYFFDRLVKNDANLLTDFRLLFGNEQVDYSDALEAYYKYGAPVDWKDSFISKYATSHPWEDWAETWAHYLHIMDIVETAYFFGMQTNPKGTMQDMDAKVTFDPYTIKDFNEIIKVCIPLVFAINRINRAMGVPEVYPFTITPPVVKKMTFIHEILLLKR